MPGAIWGGRGGEGREVREDKAVLRLRERVEPEQGPRPQLGDQGGLHRASHSTSKATRTDCAGCGGQGAPAS